MLYETVNVSGHAMESHSYFSGWTSWAKKWLRKNQNSLVLFCGVLAVGTLGFEAGFIQGKSKHQEPLRIELAPEERVNSSSASQSPSPLGESAERTSDAPNTEASLSAEACAFVASRNSKLFHASTCAVVKRIKPANKLCFKERSEAEARGLTAGCVK
jgi:hypothetical protein